MNAFNRYWFSKTTFELQLAFKLKFHKYQIRHYQRYFQSFFFKTLSAMDLDKCCSSFLHSSTENLKINILVLWDYITRKKLSGYRNYLEGCWLPIWLLQCFWQCLYCSICTLFFLQMLPPSSLWKAAGLWDFWQKHSASHAVSRIQMFVQPQRLKKEFHSGNICQKSKYRY